MGGGPAGKELRIKRQGRKRRMIPRAKASGGGGPQAVALGQGQEGCIRLDFFTVFCAYTHRIKEAKIPGLWAHP